MKTLLLAQVVNGQLVEQVQCMQGAGGAVHACVFLSAAGARA